MRRLEGSLSAWRRHPLLRCLREEHTLHGLPMVATEDACALLGAGPSGVKLFPWRVRPMRGEASAHAAALPPPPPPADYSPTRAAGSYEPPKAYEAGANIFDFKKIFAPTKYEHAPPPPEAPPPELRHAMDVCARHRPPRTHARAAGCALGVIGLPEDEVSHLLPTPTSCSTCGDLCPSAPRPLLTTVAAAYTIGAHRRVRRAI